MARGRTNYSRSESLKLQPLPNPIRITFPPRPASLASVAGYRKNLTNLQQLKDQEPMQIIILMIQRYACSKIRKVAEVNGKR